MQEPSDDSSLIQRSVAGDTTAFDQLVIRYQSRLVHSLELCFTSRDDALEIAQTAFISAWRKLSSFQQESSFYSWLYRIAMNAGISRRRRERLRTVSLQARDDNSSIAVPNQSPSASPDEQLQNAETVEIIREELRKVSPEFRAALVLKEIDGFSYEQISDILEIPIGTVRSRIFRARQELADRLRRQFLE
ncbi:MAG: sigma-70 family RNA polymerase sigma factor [Planctomycetaceae bacterium]|nr:sigma-70 family RNA polymerase sigma factor [Planctomycetaceae bacterium]